MSPSPRLAVALLLLASCTGCRWIEGDHRWTALDGDYALEVHSVDDPVIEETSRHFAGPQPVEPLVQQAITASPELQAAYLRADAHRSRTRATRWLDDPRLAVNVGLEPVQTAAGQQDLSLAVSQPLKRLGKWDVQVVLAQTEVDLAMAVAERTRQSVAERTRRAYADLYEAQSVAERLNEQRNLIDTVARLARVKYENGLIGERQWQQVNLELIALDQRIQSQQQKVTAAQTKLAGLIGLSPLTPIMALSELPEVPLPGDRNQYFELALQTNPDLQARLFEMRRAQLEVELACQQRHPDPTVTATWIDTSNSGISPVANGRDSVLLGVSMGLPIYRQRLYAEVDEARANASSAIMEFREERLDKQTEVESYYDAVQLTRQQIAQLDQELLPEAERTYRSSLQQFEGDLVSLDDVLEDARRILEIQSDRARLQANQFRSHASLRRLLGGRLPATTEGNGAPGGPETIMPPRFDQAQPTGLQQPAGPPTGSIAPPAFAQPIPTSSRRVDPFTNHMFR